MKRYLVAPMLIAVDQLLRLAAHATYARDSSSQFGWFGLGRLQNPFILDPFEIGSIGLTIAIVIFALELTTWPDWKFTAMSLNILAAGAVSNLAESVLRGFSTDYILLFFAPGDWLAINLADVFIAVGLVLSVLSIPRLLKTLVWTNAETTIDSSAK